MFTENGTQYDDNGIPLGVRILPDGSYAPRIDASGFAYHPFGVGTIRDWLTYSEFTKFDDNDPDNQKIAYVRKGYHIEWKNVLRDLKNAWSRVGNPLGIQYPLPWYAQFGAIAVDAADIISSPATSGSTSSYNHTCSGANRIIASGITKPGGSITDWSYNSAAITNDVSVSAQVEYQAMGHLVAPSTGSNSLSITISVSYGANNKGWIGGVSFTGAKQSSQPDATATDNNTTSPSNLSITTVADNCYIIDVIAAAASGGTLASSTSTIAGQGTGVGGSPPACWGMGYRSAGTAGAYTMNFSYTAAGGFDHAAISVSPAPQVGPVNVKTWDGLASASISKLNNLSYASVKSINGLQ